MTIDFEVLFAKSPNPYVILDPALVLVWMNDAYLAATMREREDLVGRTMFEAFPSDPASEGHRLLAESFDRVIETAETDEIALIRYDIARPDGSMEERYWSATHTPLNDGEGKPCYILQHTVDVTELHGLRRLRDEMGVVRRASSVQARNRDLAEESRKLFEVFEQAPGFVAALTGPEHRFLTTNEAYRKLARREELDGMTVAEALPEVVGQGYVELLDRVYSTGEPYVGRREAVVIAGEEPGEGGRRYLNFVYQPVFDDADQVTGIIVQGNDVTEEVEYEERQTLLINELNHRVKNTLAIVQGLARQSFKTIEDADHARATYDARLQALAAAHNLLTDSSWGSARLADIIHRSAEATTGSLAGRFEVDGPDILLPPQTAVSLAMIIHELGTNALKYGALSVDMGKVRISWTIESAEEGRRLLRLSWQESGGPSIEQAGPEGFGTRLIRQGVSCEGGGRVEMNFARAGLTCLIETVLEPEQA